MEFALPLTQELQNKQVFFGVKVNVDGVESVRYSKGIDIGTVCMSIHITDIPIPYGFFHFSANYIHIKLTRNSKRRSL